jgi:quercetin dioxygenase-like cupin family protein
LLHLLEGEVEVTILDDDAGAQTSTRPAGSVMVVPRGQWHRLLARGPVRVCGVTGPTDHSDSGGARKREFA